jgi:hypothetical protein
VEASSENETPAVPSPEVTEAAESPDPPPEPETVESTPEPPSEPTPEAVEEPPPPGKSFRSKVVYSLRSSEQRLLHAALTLSINLWPPIEEAPIESEPPAEATPEVAEAAGSPDPPPEPTPGMYF